MEDTIIRKLKQRLIAPLPGRTAQFKMAPSHRPDVIKPENAIKAGVLILLYPNPIDLHIVLMKRTEYPGVHSAQISFPGGKYELTDKSLVNTAIREAKEEIGVAPELITVLGALTPLYIPVSEIEVHPVVAYAPHKLSFTINKVEVDYLIEVSVEKLLHFNAIYTKSYSSDKYSGTIPYYDIQGNHVWGATAMIMSEFIEVLNSIS
jgi:8-oxo-dGTP pyrophosphatase MutT (NUDIX family)